MPSAASQTVDRMERFAFDTGWHPPMSLPTCCKSEAEVDAAIAAVFARPEGEALLRWMEAEWSVLSAPLIRESIARARKRWAGET